MHLFVRFQPQAATFRATLLYPT